MVLLTVAGAPAAHASSTICVALVVDDADLGGGVHTTCAKVPQGATGYDVLRAGGHTFTICSNGVLGAIDGKPADGCRVKDDSHYWAYWHRAPHSTTWTYSDEGGGTYQPANASTEGWVWQNGSTRRPANVPYDDICKPAPRPTPTHTLAAAPASSAAPAAVAHPKATVRSTATARPTAPARRTTARSRATIAAGPTSSTPTALAGTPTPHATSAAHPGSGSSAAAALGGGAAIAAVGIAAAVRQRRGR